MNQILLGMAKWRENIMLSEISQIQKSKHVLAAVWKPKHWWPKPKNRCEEILMVTSALHPDTCLLSNNETKDKQDWIMKVKEQLKRKITSNADQEE